jgi:hypothetical protein
MTGGETNRAIGTEHTQLRKPSSAQRGNKGPQEMVLLVISIL